MVASRKSRSTDLGQIAALVGRELIQSAELGEQVVVAYSGGLDSSALLHSALASSREIGFRIRALHVNHGISQNADRWADHCQHTCSSWGVDLDIVKASVNQEDKNGLESAARQARYSIFENIVADKVLLAHHADDQAETVLHNLLRGAGVRGLGAMRLSNGRFVRPLLLLPREIIVKYAKEVGLSWVNDESNADLRFTRNYLRHELIPHIEQRFQAATKQLAKTATRLSEADDLLRQLALMDGGETGLLFPLSLRKFVHLDTARAINLLRYALYSKKIQAPGHHRIIEFIRQIKTAGADRHPELKVDRWLLRTKGGLLHLTSIDDKAAEGE